MVLKATVKKPNSKQSFAKVSSEAAVGRCYSKQVLVCWSPFLVKLKKRLQHWCFLVNVAKFLRATFLIEQIR